MFKAIANWFKGLLGKAEQEVVKDKQVVDSFEKWSTVVNEIPKAKVEEVKKPYPIVAEGTVKPAPTKAEKNSRKKDSTKPAKETTKTTAKTSKPSTKPAQKAGKPAAKTTPKSNTTNTTK
jgi:hypothetical protein